MRFNIHDRVVNIRDLKHRDQTIYSPTLGEVIERDAFSESYSVQFEGVFELVSVHDSDLAPAAAAASRGIALEAMPPPPAETKQKAPAVAASKTAVPSQPAKPARHLLRLHRPSKAQAPWWLELTKIIIAGLILIGFSVMMIVLFRQISQLRRYSVDTCTLHF